LDWSVFAPLLALALAAAPSPLKLAAPNLRSANLPADSAAFFSEHLAQQLTLRGFKVTGSAEIGTLIGLERQRQLLGCNDQASCLTEIAAALGVDGVLTGNVGKFEDTFALNVKVVSARDASMMAIYSSQAEGEKALLDELNRAAEQLARQLLGRSDQPLLEPKPNQPAAAVTPPPVSEPAPYLQRRNTPMRNAGKWTLIGGAATLGLGVLVAIGAENREPATSTGGGLILLGLGGGVVGGILYLLGGQEPAPVQAGLLLARSGFGVQVSGTLP
jgi:hypothetical protein